MYKFNSNYYNNKLLRSLSEATNNVFLNEQKRKYVGSTTYRMADIDKLSPEQQSLLRQTQAAAEKAERDPETGALKVAGMIAGVPRTGPGGDLYGVDVSGQPLVTVSRYEDVPDEPKAPAGAMPSAETPKVPLGPAVGSKNVDTSKTKDPFNVDFGISETERLRRLQNAENIAADRAKAHGENKYDIPLEFSTSDIRKPQVGQFAAPGASAKVDSVVPQAESELQKQIQRLEAIKQRTLELKRRGIDRVRPVRPRSTAQMISPDIKPGGYRMGRQDF